MKPKVEVLESLCRCPWLAQLLLTLGALRLPQPFWASLLTISDNVGY